MKPDALMFRLIDDRNFKVGERRNRLSLQHDRLQKEIMEMSLQSQQDEFEEISISREDLNRFNTFQLESSETSLDRTTVTESFSVSFIDNKGTDIFHQGSFPGITNPDQTGDSNSLNISAWNCNIWNEIIELRQSLLNEFKRVKSVLLCMTKPSD